MSMKTQYINKSRIILFYPKKFLVNAATCNHRGKPALKDENFGIFGENC